MSLEKVFFGWSFVVAVCLIRQQLNKAMHVQFPKKWLMKCSVA
jgi:hypothetical protein